MKLKLSNVRLAFPALFEAKTVNGEGSPAFSAALLIDPADKQVKASYDGFPGNLYISARNPVRPTVLDADKTPLVAADGKPYAGCYVNVSLELWAQDNKYGKRVNATLMGVQFYRDGDSFTGGGAADESDFDDVSAGATADDLA
jgi:hypothetical protein